MTRNADIDARSKIATDGLLARLAHARIALVATEDGLQVAASEREPLDAARLAAITSSLSAIGDVVAQETGVGRVRCLMVEADGGYLVMRAARCADVGLVVAALVDREALLGLVIHAVGETARGLAQ